MRGLLVTLAAVLTLALTMGVGTALAGNTVGGIAQEQNASNTIDQYAKAGAVAVNLSPNIAVLNFGDTNQRSSADAGAAATNVNTGDQSNQQSQDAQQSEGRSDGGSIDQSQQADNTIEQSGTATAAAVNLSPNVAVLNFGDTNQRSSADAGAAATNINTGDQSNQQSQDADQQGGGSSDYGYGKQNEDGNGGGSIDQSQNASNTIDQDASASAKSVNAAPNVAVGNGWGEKGYGKQDGRCKQDKHRGGDTRQTSGSQAGAFAGNVNTGDQSNHQSQDAQQSGDKHDRGYGKQDGKKSDGGSIEQTQNASNTIDQDASAKAKSFNLSPNVALLNFGDTHQSSSSSAEAFAGNLNTGDQSNSQSQDAQQSGGKGDWYGKKSDGGSIEQTQNASNTIDQDASAKAKSFNLSPNVAVLNFGDTHQSSSSSAEAFAGNLNTGDQSNCQSQQANQGGDDCHRAW